MEIQAMVPLDLYKAGRLERTVSAGSWLTIPRMDGLALIEAGHARGSGNTPGSEVLLIEQWRYRYVMPSRGVGFLTRLWNAVRGW